VDDESGKREVGEASKAEKVNEVKEAKEWELRKV